MHFYMLNALLHVKQFTVLSQDPKIWHSLFFNAFLDMICILRGKDIIIIYEWLFDNTLTWTASFSRIFFPSFKTRDHIKHYSDVKTLG